MEERKIEVKGARKKNTDWSFKVYQRFMVSLKTKHTLDCKNNLTLLFRECELQLTIFWE